MNKVGEKRKFAYQAVGGVDHCLYVAESGWQRVDTFKVDFFGQLLPDLVNKTKN